MHMLGDFVTATFCTKSTAQYMTYFQDYTLQWLCAFNELISPNRNVLTNLYGGILMLQ